MTEQSHQVEANEKGLRIDKLLAKINDDASRSQAQQWIENDYVMVNGEHIKSNFKCQPGDVITWNIPDPKPLKVEAENIPLHILYEDSDVLIVSKPKGMVVHPSAGHMSGTLVNALLYHCQDLSGINGTIRPGIVHRIDKDTSGLLVVAKNDHAHALLASQLKDKKVERKYLALVHGSISHEYGTIDAPIGRDPKDRQKMAVVEGGRAAVTHFEVKEKFDGFTFVQCVLETGRTHQIRVHMHYIGHPIAGDPKYGPRKTLDLEGQALHASTLGFTHPATGEWMSFHEKLPATLEEELDNLRKMC
ncbi:RluA family pseudouridine synthase [Aquibacillus sp. 3ASR75-11]|uniref:Pseudouridine synthase n=1 Tax=Terrihalobacillus insolitus TaxID=2950438 RepID=A0A9X4AL07_9BACI|nr:RluA family pseudouridine synthase [Terrihalobacillus insolitus]MDC3412853.1 RluA family pseudouridine synthase [Terrihalobacillus insolitus]MDC3423671.1 RluA family pseudouridine synthase [Terrihalobacillus insolitus]